MERELTLYERPYGALPWLGTALAVWMYAQAAWLVAARFLGHAGSGAAAFAEAAERPAALLLACGACALYLLAARATDSIVDRAAFLACAAAELLRALARPAARLGSVAAAAAGLLPWALLTAAFLLLSINRENTRDARSFAGLAAPALLARFAGGAAAYYGAAALMQGLKPLRASLRVVTLGGTLSFFAAIASYVLMAAVFLFLRTPTKAAQYPKKSAR